MPSQLSESTPGAELPAGGAVGDWIAFGDAQTGQLDKANLTKGAALAIVRACEARDRAVDAALAQRSRWLRSRTADR